MRACMQSTAEDEAALEEAAAEAEAAAAAMEDFDDDYDVMERCVMKVGRRVAKSELHRMGPAAAM